MRRAFLTLISLLLAVALAGGLAGCSRSASTRDSEATDPAATDAVGLPLDVGAAAPPSNETVVSAMPAGIEVNPGVVDEQATASASFEVSPTEVVTDTPEAVATPLPAATETPAPNSGDGTVTHTVQSGETLDTIAALYGTTTQAIAEANNLSNPSQIYPGQTLTIPTSAGSNSGGNSAGKTAGQSGGKKPACRYKHVVKRGEWVWKIAHKYGVSPQKVLRANRLTGKKANMIYAGQVLCIP